jgi:hypothetical protein
MTERGFPSLIYGTHNSIITLGESISSLVFTKLSAADAATLALAGEEESRFIFSSNPPIHVFWHNKMKLENPDGWPANRKWRATTGGSICGVFVAYYSVVQPLENLGRAGDLWVTPDAIFVKDLANMWIPWTKSSTYACPYDASLKLIWSRNAHFKYLRYSRTERSRWTHCMFILRIYYPKHLI